MRDCLLLVISCYNSECLSLAAFIILGVGRKGTWISQPVPQYVVTFQSKISSKAFFKKTLNEDVV